MREGQGGKECRGQEKREEREEGRKGEERRAEERTKVFPLIYLKK